MNIHWCMVGKKIPSYKLIGSLTLLPQSYHMIKISPLVHQFMRKKEQLYEYFYIHKYCLLFYNISLTPKIIWIHQR